MTDMTCEVRYQDVVSPMLVDSTVSPSGHYNVQPIWWLDSTTLLPVGMSQNITFPS